MLWQLHQQPKKGDGQTFFYAQRDLDRSSKATHDFVADTINAYPLRDGYQWLICNEASKYFVRSTATIDRPDGVMREEKEGENG